MNVPKNLYDVVIIGGGPAGLTAAIYLARARYRVVVVEKDRTGGQIALSGEVANYPGVSRTDGAHLTETMRQQAEDFGAEFLTAEARRLDLDGTIKRVDTTSGELQCFGVLLATGASPRKAGFRGESEFLGRGVAYCAICDGEFFQDTEVFVIGGGYAAAEEGVFLTRYASHVTIVIRGEDFSCAKSLADAARHNEKITVLPHTEVVSVSGDTALRSLTLRDRKTGEEREYRPPEGKTFGVFVFAGYTPATDLVKGVAELNEQGYVVTDRTLKTSVDGLYAAGDVCIKSLRQVATAVGDGALAATELERLAATMRETTGMYPETSETADTAQTPKESNAAPEVKHPLFSDETLAQLYTIFDKMKAPLILDVALDDRPVSEELRTYMMALAELTNKLTVKPRPGTPEEQPPCVRICREDGQPMGMAFHGVPGGHEFTSFVLTLYNAAGPGQILDDEVRTEIASINRNTKLDVLVTLNCSMCPELVNAAQRIAAENPNVTTDVYDVAHFPALREKYQVMSVPCLVINDHQVQFGKKNLRQVLDMLEK